MNRSVHTALSTNEVHLWLAQYDQIANEQLHADYRALMSDEEREQEHRFYFARDRRRYLVTRALVRSVLSKYAGTAPAEWRFAKNAYGRPYIANSEVQCSRLSFNVSHTHSLIVLAVAKDREIGVDVENVLAREAPIAIADSYFSPTEVAALATVQPDQKQYRFYEYWTFKESYIKARGMGLSIPLDKFHFDFPRNDSVRVALHNDLGDDPLRWKFWQFQWRGEYLIAVCAQKDLSCEIEVKARQVVPMVSEEVVAPVFLRTSQ